MVAAAVLDGDVAVASDRNDIRMRLTTEQLIRQEVETLYDLPLHVDGRFLGNALSIAVHKQDLALVKNVREKMREYVIQ